MINLKSQRGSLIFAYLLILVLTILSAALMIRGANETKVAWRQANSTNALWVAEAGLQKVLWEFKNNNCLGLVQQGTNTACTDCTCNSAVKSVAATLTNYGDYDATLNSSNTLIQSVGSVPSRTSTKRIQRNVQGSFPSTALFNYAAFAQGSVAISNNAIVDSYNSTNGSYGGANVSSNGDIGSNGTTAGIINVSNNAAVLGNASTGSGGSVTIGNGGSVSGAITNTNNVSLPSVVVPSSLTSLASGGTLSVGNKSSITINEGSYKYSSLSMDNNSILTVSGDVKLYLTSATAFVPGNGSQVIINTGAKLTVYSDGVITFSNNSISNNNQDPSKFLIYSTYTGANGVDLSNNGSLYAAVYAPQTNVNVANNAGFYGATVGKTVGLSNNGAIHYDKNLNTLSNPFSLSTLLSNWQEY